ncbi:MAG: ComF family protein [Spirochaetaceae bacterium]|jgi:ComF family protein|nr:ComF family protein [Spirochaetaceae bacterium]
MNILSIARELCFPLGCALCGEPLTGGKEASTGICLDCAAIFELDWTEKRCACCGKPLISELSTCISCKNIENNGCKPCYDRALVLYPYIDKWRAILSAYKFGKHRMLARFFAGKLAAAAAHGTAGTENGTTDGTDGLVWIPVPARRARIKEKGWDHVEALARILEREHKFPVMRALRRLPSKSQKELGRAERLVNLKGRIVPSACCRRGALAGKKVILFDDVYTTGATLNSCAEVLKANGAVQVFGLCLFYD